MLLELLNRDCEYVLWLASSTSIHRCKLSSARALTLQPCLPEYLVYGLRAESNSSSCLLLLGITSRLRKAAGGAPLTLQPESKTHTAHIRRLPILCRTRLR